MTVVRFPIERTRHRSPARIDGCLALALEAEIESTSVLKLVGRPTRITDRENATTRFTYDDRHNLLTIIDPRGIEVAAMDYDDSGRLISSGDPTQAPTQFVHDIAARTETVVSPTGLVSVVTYDDEGNVLTTTDPLGNVTRRSYDEFSNEIAVIDALGRVTTNTYDDRDFLTSTTDANGTTRYERDAFGIVTKTTDPMGRVTENVFDNYGNMQSSRDAFGNLTTYEYYPNVVMGVEMPGRGPLKQTTDPMGGVTFYSYNSDGTMRMMRDPAGNATFYTYNSNGVRTSEVRTRTLPGGGTEELTTTYDVDAEGRVKATHFPDGSVTSVEFNPLGLEGVRIDPRGNRTELGYDNQARLERTTYPDRTFELTEFNAEGQRVAFTDRRGKTTRFEFDPAGRLVKTIFPGGKFTRTEFDSAGQVIVSIDRRGNATRFEYDSAGQRVKMIDARGKIWSYAFDSAGNQIAMTNPLGRTTYNEYDSGNRLVRTIFPDSTYVEFAYDSANRRISERNQKGELTQFGYNILGQLVSVIDARGKETKFEFDEVGNMTAIVDARGNRTTFEHDKMGRRVLRKLPLGMVSRFEFDAAGNLRTRIDFEERRTTYTPDENNRTTERAYQDGSRATYTYTPTGKVETITDARGTRTYVYDDLDRVIRVEDPNGTIEYTHDDNDNMASAREVRGNYDVKYKYDELNRLTEVEDVRSGGRATYLYNDNGDLIEVRYPNNTTATLTYDLLDRLTSVRWTTSSGTFGYDYVLDANGNRISVSEGGRGRAVTYAFDALDRLLSEQVSNVEPVGAITYNHDEVSNRLSRITVAPTGGLPASTSQTYDANNWLNGDAHDRNGNTVGANGHTYVFDQENRVTSVDAGSISMTYQPSGLRNSKTANGTTQHFLWDEFTPTGVPQLVQIAEGASPQTATVKRVFVYGHRIISEREIATNEQLFANFDGHGSVRMVTDLSGSIAGRLDYDAFGNVTLATGDAPLHRYGGEEFDADLGFYNLRSRYYEPDRGRFWTMDEWEGDINRPITLNGALYADQNPVMKTDPTGNMSLGVALAPAMMAGNLAIGAIWNPFSWGKKAKIGSFDINLFDWVGSMPGQWMAARVRFKLTLTQGTLGDVKIKQFFRGTAYRHVSGVKSYYPTALDPTVIMNQANWTEDGPGFWWTGSAWRNQSSFPALLANPIFAPVVPVGNSASTTATWGDAPEIIAGPNNYPVYYGGHGGSGGPFTFGMVIYNSSGTKKLAEKLWGLSVNYTSPTAGVRQLYQSPATIFP